MADDPEKPDEEGRYYSLWHPPPGWMKRDPFNGRRDLVDPTVTPEQIRAAMNEQDDLTRAFNPPPLTDEQMHRPICGPGSSGPSEDWKRGFREGRISGAVSERARIARLAWATDNPLAEELDPERQFHPSNDPLKDNG